MHLTQERRELVRSVGHLPPQDQTRGVPEHVPPLRQHYEEWTVVFLVVSVSRVSSPRVR